MDIDNICMNYSLRQFRNIYLANIAEILTGNILLLRR